MTMHLSTIRNCLFGGILAAGMGVWAGAAEAQGSLKGTFGDWQMRCDTVPGRPGEQCILMQSLIDDQNTVDGQKVEINLVVVALKASDPKANNIRKPVLRVIAPLGVLLPRGLGLKIDQTEIGATGFVRCLANGCVAEVEMDDALLEKLRKGKEATFVIFLTPDEGRGLPLRMEGFDKGFAQLQ